jgi:limonene-1,2-epoxide hydrolase
MDALRQAGIDVRYLAATSDDTGIIKATPEMEVVRSFLKALEAQDLDHALTYVSDEVEYQNMPVPALRGPKGIRRVFGPTFKASGFEARINKIAANGTTVLTERTDAVFVGPVRIPFQICARSRSATTASSCGATPSTGRAAWSTS